LLTEVRTAIAAYADAGGGLTTTIGAPGTVADLLADINAVLSGTDPEGDAETLLAGLDAADFDESAGAVGGSTDTALNNIVEEVAERGALIDAVVAAEGA